MTMKWMPAALAALTLLAAAPLAAFEKIPSQARKELGGVRGKKISTGYVFANGKYMPPPYTVARIGNSIHVNSQQVTGQVVHWKKFLLTQPGAAEAFGLNKPDESGDSAFDSAKSSAKSSSVDDLFDDESSDPWADETPTPPPAPAAPAAPPPEEPLPDIAFSMNAPSKALLKQVNDRRTQIDKQLRTGAICFFGSKHAPVVVPPRMTKEFMAVFPEALRDSAGGEELLNALRAKGFRFFQLELCKNLINNRADYLQLMNRRQKEREEDDLQSILSGRR